MTTQETDPDLPVSVQQSPVEAWVNSLALGQTIGREHSPAHQNKTQFPPQSSPSHQEASIILLSLFIRE